MNDIATSQSWKNSPIDQPYKISTNLSFNTAQFDKMILGYIPIEMENKWFIFYENECFYFHRSWTGHGIYKACIHKIGSTYYISEFDVERNTEKYQNKNDEKDIRDLMSLIKYLLLKEY